MDRHGIRYTFEHRILPSYFYSGKIQFIGDLLYNKELLFRIIDDIFKKERVKNPYSKEDFKINTAKIKKNVFMLRIGFPEPEEAPLCYCSYLFFDEKFKKTSYFCIEKGGPENNYYPFICSWTEKGLHLNHGNGTFDDHNNLLRCAGIHMGK